MAGFTGSNYIGGVVLSDTTNMSEAAQEVRDFADDSGMLSEALADLAGTIEFHGWEAELDHEALTLDGCEVRDAQ